MEKHSLDLCKSNCQEYCGIEIKKFENLDTFEYQHICEILMKVNKNTLNEISIADCCINYRDNK